jgi:hypothetical protein
MPISTQDASIHAYHYQSEKFEIDDLSQNDLFLGDSLLTPAKMMDGHF